MEIKEFVEYCTKILDQIPYRRILKAANINSFIFGGMEGKANKKYSIGISLSKLDIIVKKIVTHLNPAEQQEFMDYIQTKFFKI